MNNDRNTCVYVYFVRIFTKMYAFVRVLFSYFRSHALYLYLFFILKTFHPVDMLWICLPKIAWGSLETITIKMELDSWKFERFSYLFFGFISKISDLSLMKSFSSWLFPVSTTQTDLSGGLIYQ